MVKLTAVHFCNVLPPETLQHVKEGLLYAQKHFPQDEEFRLLRQDIALGLQAVQVVEYFRNEQARMMDNAEKAAGEIIKRIFK